MWLGLKATIGDDGGIYFKWIDGMYDSFTNWALGEPADVTGSSCFYISKDLDSSGKWYSTNNCHQTRPYVCKLELKSALPDWSGEDKRGAVIPCDKPWETFGHHCYLPHKYGSVVYSISLYKLRIKKGNLGNNGRHVRLIGSSTCSFSFHSQR